MVLMKECQICFTSHKHKAGADNWQIMASETVFCKNAGNVARLLYVIGDEPLTTIIPLYDKDPDSGSGIGKKRRRMSVG